MTEPFFDRISNIDNIIEKGPGKCDFSKDVKPLLKEDSAKKYFYDNLKDPAWLKKLESAGEFHEFPIPIRLKESTKYPLSPASYYLARMASHEPKDVLKIILQTPDTDNFIVHTNLTEAALKMPPEYAIKLIPKIKSWLDISWKTHSSILPTMLADLIIHLAKNGQVKGALELTQLLFRKEILEQQPLPDLWHYEAILKKIVPSIMENGGKDALILLRSLLEYVVSFKREKEGIDRSSWRPAIEDHEQNFHDDLKNELVSSVRGTAEFLMGTEGSEVLKIVEKRPFKIFKRIGLHLRRKWPNIDREGTEELVVDQTLFYDSDMHHEYYHLVHELFETIDRKKQKEYLDFIDKATKAFATELMIDRNKDLKGKDLDLIVNRWYYSKLWPIQNSLDEKRSKNFNELKKKFKDIKHPDFLYYVTGGIGPLSPKEPIDFKSMDIGDIISYLKDWQPSEDPFGPSPEGLGRTLTGIVASDPESFTAYTEQFKELEPTYVRSFLSGLEKALKEEKRFSWDPVLVLCQWIVEQPIEEPPKKERSLSDFDQNWNETRKQIGHLIYEGLLEKEGKVSFDLRNEVWEVIFPLTKDPDPIQEIENSLDTHPSVLSINTTRGEAMHATVNYALWVRRNIKKETDGDRRLERGFDEISEVRDVLDSHLNPEIDQSPSVRSVYGKFFPQLFLLDSKWVKENLNRIFPRDGDFKQLYNATWETYLIYCPPYDEIFKLLSEDYKIAIEKISEGSDGVGVPANPNKRLVDHLMTFYWRGKLDLDESGGLLSSFYSKAPESLHEYALEFIGHSLHNTVDEVPSEILERLKKLWQYNIESSEIEFTSFGWWFGSRKFDENWAIEKLKEVLKITGKVETDNLVVKYLGELASKMPLITVECLELIIKGDKEEWRINFWKDEAKEILKTVLTSDDSGAQENAKSLVHYLGSLGYIEEFRELLS